MKKIKEFIKKIDNKKYCLLSFLLASLLLFAIVGGLNGSKSAKTEVNASAPTTKNLDLNGVRYTYQTSLNELKNTYGFFKRWYYGSIFKITNNSEGETQLFFEAQEDGVELNTEEINKTAVLLQQSIKLYQKELNSGDLKELDNTTSHNSVDGSNNTNDLIFDFDNINSFARLKNFSVNFSLLKRIPYYKTLTSNSFTMNFIYVEENLDNTELENIEYMDKHVKCFAFCFSNQVEYYNFNLPILEGYTIRNIYLTFEDEEQTTKNTISQSIPSKFIFLDQGTYFDTNICIDNITFYNNNNANIISYYFKYDRDYVNDPENELFTGNLLLSETNYDRDLYTYLENTIPRKQLELKFNSNVRFGGNFEFTQPRRSILFTPVEDHINGFYVAAFGYANDNNWKNSYFYKSLNRDIIYLNQNRLLYLSGFENLRMNNANYSGSALSAQVQDILYNVEYSGNIEEKEFEEKVQQDFENLVKTTGLGAFIGLIVGLIFGNPGLGAAIGAGWGFLAGIIPLIIDGLQAIFGKNAFTGLYNFFKSITQFFTNIVDSIINFLLSIITNPATLILIVIFAILYIIYYFQKK